MGLLGLPQDCLRPVLRELLGNLPDFLSLTSASKGLRASLQDGLVISWLFRSLNVSVNYDMDYFKTIKIFSIVLKYVKKIEFSKELQTENLVQLIEHMPNGKAFSDLQRVLVDELEEDVRDECLTIPDLMRLWFRENFSLYYRGPSSWRQVSVYPITLKCICLLGQKRALVLAQKAFIYLVTLLLISFTLFTLNNFGQISINRN